MNAADDHFDRTCPTCGQSCACVRCQRRCEICTRPLDTLIDILPDGKRVHPECRQQLRRA